MFVTFFSQHRSLAIIAAALVLGIVIAIAWQQYFRSPSTGSTSSPQASSGQAPAATGTPPAIPPPPSAGGTPQPPLVPLYRGQAVQSLNPNPDILKQVPADTYEKSRNELADLAVSLAANPRSTDGWMRVAFIKRFYGDYPGERDAYEYLNIIAPGDGLPFYNLAGLYGYYLKEPVKAVPKYEAALRLDGMNPTYYIGFADFYREVANDLPAAERVLERGLEKMPIEANLLQAYAVVSKAMGKIARAIEYYEKVLATATLTTEQRSAISAEIERLKAQGQ